MIEACLVVSLLFNVFQFIFWARIVDRLENKLMSRDFFNYMDVKSPAPKSNSVKTFDDDIDLNTAIQPF